MEEIPLVNTNTVVNNTNNNSQSIVPNPILAQTLNESTLSTVNRTITSDIDETLAASNSKHKPNRVMNLKSFFSSHKASYKPLLNSSESDFNSEDEEEIYDSINILNHSNSKCSCCNCCCFNCCCHFVKQLLAMCFK